MIARSVERPGGVVLDLEAGPPPPRSEPCVRDVMLRAPKTLDVSATVEEARTALRDDHVHMVLLTRGTRLLGTVLRADLDQDLIGTDPALASSALQGRTAAPAAPAEVVRALMISRALRRLAVVDERSTLLGLLCLKRSATGFCSDAGVRARASQPRPCGVDEGDPTGDQQYPTNEETPWTSSL